jgi:hypothetical protein
MKKYEILQFILVVLFYPQSKSMTPSECALGVLEQFSDPAKIIQKRKWTELYTYLPPGEQYTKVMQDMARYDAKQVMEALSELESEATRLFQRARSLSGDRIASSVNASIGLHKRRLAILEALDEVRGSVDIRINNFPMALNRARGMLRDTINQAVERGYIDPP